MNIINLHSFDIKVLLEEHAEVFTIIISMYIPTQMCDILKFWDSEMVPSKFVNGTYMPSAVIATTYYAMS